MIVEPIAVFCCAFFYIIFGAGAQAQGSFFEVDEQHDFQVPVLPTPNHVSRSKSIIRQNIIAKLLAAATKEKEKEQSASGNLNSILISGPELLEIRDLLIDDKCMCVV